MTISHRKHAPRLRVLAALVALAACGAAQAQHAKLDTALSDIVDQQARRQFRSLAVEVDAIQAQVDGMSDDQGRLLVDIYLEPGASLADVQASLTAAGAAITGVNAAFGAGAISAYVPTTALSSLSGVNGLHLMKLTRRPQRNVGAVTSQGAPLMRSNVANAAGWTGAGITVGVLSDSYDQSPLSFTTVRAANDIATGDLRPPKFVIDNTPGASNTDEGRAMMQIVQDVAPAADLCFASAFLGEAAFAANIRRLRTDPACRADVIVDDVFYFDEPFFSDGQVAQAVNDVVTSTTLAGRPVSYFSSAGNQGSAGGGGSIDVPFATFSTTPTNLGNINLASLSTCAGTPATGSTKANVAGGFLDFGGGNFAPSVTYNTAGSQLLMQWDDPFYQGKVTTDLNFYLINSAGSCVFSYGTNNINADYGMENVNLSGGASGTYRIMVGRTSAGTNQATRVRMVSLKGWGGAPFQVRNSPTTFGHSAAAGANSVAAYRYTFPATQQSPFIPAFESFSSPGPVTIAFDAVGNRLPVPETRKKPDMAAPDGGNTTFFYKNSDFEGDGFNNFFGTSAAAPHAAAVAALMLHKAGGPGTLTPKQVKTLLQSTPAARVIPFSGGAAVKTWSVYDGFGLIDAVNALNKLP
ncbi:S8 family serine peptidase [Mitsuaria sp. GD03876]|uniref:S8 family serine peptidase n=1 Tax=Mitsuaria sp. GD03876 TaxID=2975399 RepID=UPI00244D65EA|nr:S8 family serine peptidase [Mitsuaria sp. GD03876]MDH0863442.1 S8 family serine peptidase [Mitsuaria sp. GD03876]